MLNLPASFGIGADCGHLIQDMGEEDMAVFSCFFCRSYLFIIMYQSNASNIVKRIIKKSYVA